MTDHADERAIDALSHRINSCGGLADGTDPRVFAAEFIQSMRLRGGWRPTNARLAETWRPDTVRRADPTPEWRAARDQLRTSTEKDTP